MKIAVCLAIAVLLVSTLATGIESKDRLKMAAKMLIRLIMEKGLVEQSDITPETDVTYLTQLACARCYGIAEAPDEGLVNMYRSNLFFRSFGANIIKAYQCSRLPLRSRMITLLLTKCVS